MKTKVFSWKEFVYAEAERLGITRRAMQSRISRGRHDIAGKVNRGPSGRCISVTLKSC